MRRAVQASMLLDDHSKLGVTSRMQYATSSEISLLVTDSAASTLPAFAALQNKLADIVLA